MNEEIGKLNRRILRTYRKMWDLEDKHRDIRRKIGWQHPDEKSLIRECKELRGQIAGLEKFIKSDTLRIAQIRHEMSIQINSDNNG